VDIYETDINDLPKGRELCDSDMDTDCGYEGTSLAHSVEGPFEYLHVGPTVTLSNERFIGADSETFIANVEDKR